MILIHYIIIILSLLLFSGCSQTPEDSSNKNIAPSSTVSPGTEAGTSVSIGPADANINSIINILPDGSTPLPDKVSWYVNDSIDEKNKSRRFVSDSLKKGDRIRAVIVRGSKKMESHELIIQNSPPSIHRAILLPERPGALTTIMSEVSADDIDGDIVDLRYKWYLNGKFVDEHSYLEYEFKRGDKVALELIPFDEESNGKSVRLETEIYNSLPVINKSSPSIEGRTYKYQIAATDADGDPLDYKIDKGPEGMKISTDGLITWDLPDDLKSQYEVTVSVNDKHGGVKIIPFTASIYFEDIKE